MHMTAAHLFSATSTMSLPASMMNILVIRFDLLQREICKDWSEGLAVSGPVGVEFNNPGDTGVFLQLLLSAERHTALDWILNVSIR